MLKRIDKDKLMDINFLGRSVIIKTVIGGISENIGGTIAKQTFAGLAKTLTLSVVTGLYTLGIDLIKEVYINFPDAIIICPNCKRACIWGQWVTIEVPEVFVTDVKCCPECDKE